MDDPRPWGETDIFNRYVVDLPFEVHLLIPHAIQTRMDALKKAKIFGTSVSGTNTQASNLDMPKE